MYNITGKEPVFFEGVWIPDSESFNDLEKEELSIRGTKIRNIVDTILQKTSEPGFIELYKINLSSRHVEPIKVINVVNELEFCI